MELRQLRYFVAVAEAGNISRAAKRIFLTQPALSRQIKALEDEMGQRLLDRQAHSIQITPAGQVLVREARELLEHAEQVLERVRAAGRGLCLRVGYAPSLAAGMLSVAIENFTQTHPNAHVELHDLSTGEMLAGLEGGKLDVVLSVGQQRDGRGLKWTPAGPRPVAARRRPKSPACEAAGGLSRRSRAGTLARLLPTRLSGVLGGHHRLAARPPATAENRG